MLIIHDEVSQTMLNTVIIKQMLFILLSLDRKIKAMLDGLCWFNAANCLTEPHEDQPECMDMQMAKEWSQLWDCAGQTLYASLRQPFDYQQHTGPRLQQSGLCCRKREELVFSFRNSNLYQLLVCRHAGGSDSESHTQQLIISAKHNARLRHCAFFIV